MPVLASASPSHTVADDGRPKTNNMLCHYNLNFSPSGGTNLFIKKKKNQMRAEVQRLVSRDKCKTESHI